LPHQSGVYNERYKQTSTTYGGARVINIIIKYKKNKNIIIKIYIKYINMVLANGRVLRRGVQPFSLDGVDPSRSGRRPPNPHTPCFNQIPATSVYLSNDMYQNIRDEYKAFDTLKLQPYKTGTPLLNGSSSYIDKGVYNNNVLSRMCTNLSIPGNIEKYTQHNSSTTDRQILDNTLYEKKDDYMPTKDVQLYSKKKINNSKKIELNSPMVDENVLNTEMYNREFHTLPKQNTKIEGGVFIESENDYRNPQGNYKKNRVINTRLNPSIEIDYIDGIVTDERNQPKIIRQNIQQNPNVIISDYDDYSINDTERFNNRNKPITQIEGGLQVEDVGLNINAGYGGKLKNNTRIEHGYNIDDYDAPINAPRNIKTIKQNNNNWEGYNDYVTVSDSVGNKNFINKIKVNNSIENGSELYNDESVIQQEPFIKNIKSDLNKNIDLCTIDTDISYPLTKSQSVFALTPSLKMIRNSNQVDLSTRFDELGDVYIPNSNKINKIKNTSHLKIEKQNDDACGNNPYLIFDSKLNNTPRLVQKVDMGIHNDENYNDINEFNTTKYNVNNKQLIKTNLGFRNPKQDHISDYGKTVLNTKRPNMSLLMAERRYMQM